MIVSVSLYELVFHTHTLYHDTCIQTVSRYMFKYFNAIQKTLPEILGILICLTFGMLSGYSVTPDHLSWYHQLNAPKLTPPDFIFGPIWTILYIFLGIALGQLYRHKHKNPYCYYVFLIQSAPEPCVLR